MSDEFVKKANQILQKLRHQLNQAMVLDKWLVDQLLISVLCRGHVLVEAAPGLGKTTLVKVLSKTLDLEYHRVQCTPDLMPSDITGSNIFNPKENEFTLHKGPIFTQILLVDEINRTSPRTQSALLQAMAENQVTLDRTSYPLDDQFLVMATQNPLECSGTYPLPEAQLDRFFIKMKLEYPNANQLKKIAQLNLDHHPDQTLSPVITTKTLAQLQFLLKRITVKDEVVEYISKICEAVNKDENIRIGVSPRGCIALIRACQAYALLDGRSFVTPDDVLIMADPVLTHRLLNTGDKSVDKRFYQNVAATIPVPGMSNANTAKKISNMLELV